MNTLRKQHALKDDTVARGFVSICKRRKTLPQPRQLYSPTEERIPEVVSELQLVGMHGIRSWEGNTIILGSSDVVETIRIWRKHTSVSTLAAKF